MMLASEVHWSEHFQGQVNIPGEKKGAIYYEPDSGDDWDDDDPDDDLDF